MKKPKRPGAVRIAGDPSVGEVVLLGLILREIRHAVAVQEQAEILIDPHTVAGAKGGASLFFAFSRRGWSTDVSGIRAKRSRRRASR